MLKILFNDDKNNNEKVNLDNQIIYYGFNTIVKLSKNNPRAFLQIMKNIFKNSSFSGINMFLDGTISKEIQNISIKEASSWFWKNIIIDFDYQTTNTIIRLCEFFGDYKSYDKISKNVSRKVLTSFVYNPDEIGTLLNKYINKMINYSLLIKEDNIKYKVENISLVQLTLNPMLVPHWNLSLKNKNTILFNKDILTAIFKANNKNWHLLLKNLNIKEI
jgi:hypothetical protein